MKIEKIAAKPDRAGRVTVCFEDGSSLRLYRQTVQDHGLTVGLELSDSQMQQLLEDAKSISAKMRAVRIVAVTNVSGSELESRLLQKGEDPLRARQAVDWMEQLHLIDDAQMACQVVARCIAKGYGLARARQTLYEKKIPREYWQEALADYPDQSEAILNFLRSRLTKDAQDRDIRRATDALLRRGHSYSEIRKALQILAMDAEFVSEDS